MVRLVAKHGSEGHAAKEVRAHLDPVEKLRDAGRLDTVVIVHAHFQPRGIEVLVHLRRDRAAHRPRRLACCAQATVDRRGIGGVENHETQDVFGRELLIAFVEIGSEPGRDQWHRPGFGPGEAGLDRLVRKQRHAIGDIEQARGVFGPFDVAAHPVQLVGGATKHRIPWERYPAITQVSLVPPPCDELTTSDPSRSATRVRPPGARLTVLPERT